MKFTSRQIYQITVRGLLRTLPFLLMSSLTLATFWLVKRSSPPEALLLARVPQHVPDYILKNASLSNLNELGQTKYRILGKKLTHFEDDASMDLEFPRMRAFQAQGSAPVTVKADRGGGTFNNVQQSVTLTGQVRGRIEPSEQRGRN